MLTLDNAKRLAAGTIVYHTTKHNADGSAMRAKVTSVKTWKRSPGRVEIHVKHGLYDYAVFDENDLHLLTTDEPEPIKPVRSKALAKMRNDCTMPGDGITCLSYQQIAVLAAVYSKNQHYFNAKVGKPINVAEFTRRTLEVFAIRGYVRLQGDNVIKTPRGREYWKVLAARFKVSE